MELVSVAAVAENGVIGDDGELPWPSIPEDREQYRNRVADSPVVLGRRTFESMLDDLPGRVQIVLSRSEREYGVESAVPVQSVEEAIEEGRELDEETVYVLGGGVIYRLFQPRLDRMVLSRIHGEYEGDSYYPEFDDEKWELVAETSHDRFTLEEWVRVE